MSSTKGNETIHTKRKGKRKNRERRMEEKNTKKEKTSEINEFPLLHTGSDTIKEKILREMEEFY